jgi:hypothetical protein
MTPLAPLLTGYLGEMGRFARMPSRASVISASNKFSPSTL